MVLPHRSQRADSIPTPFEVLEAPPLPLSNFERRLHWDTEFLKRVADCDLVFTTHECIAYPLRCLAPALRIVSEKAFTAASAWPATSALQRLSLEASDTVVCVSQWLASETPNSVVWRFAYDERECFDAGRERNVDAVFPARCIFSV